MSKIGWVGCTQNSDSSSNTSAAAPYVEVIPPEAIKAADILSGKAIESDGDSRNNYQSSTPCDII